MSRSFRFTVALALIAHLLVVLAMAASPQLHEALHRDADHEDHDCLVKVLHGGGCDAAAPAPVCASCIAGLSGTVPEGVAREAGSHFLSCRILEHAPPRRA